MPAEHTLDFTRLLAPISSDSPAGRAVDLNDPVYVELSVECDKAKEDERKTRDKTKDGAVPARVNWSKVVTKSADILANHSKDLRVCAWMIEALLREQGFAGLRDGVRLTRQLCETFWDSLFPRATAIDDFDPLLACLNHLDGDNGTLYGAIYQQLNILRRLDKLDDVAGAYRELKSLADTLARKCATADSGRAVGDPPSFSSLCALLKPELPRMDATKDEWDPPSVATDESEATSSANDGAVQTHSGRRGAIQCITQAAEYFERAEPHSPLSYQLRRALRWTDLSLPELMEELLPDRKDREAYFERIGIRKDSEKQGN